MFLCVFQYVEFYGVSDSLFSSGQPKPYSVSNYIATHTQGEIEPGKSQVREIYLTYIAYTFRCISYLFTYSNYIFIYIYWLYSCIYTFHIFTYIMSIFTYISYIFNNITYIFTYAACIFDSILTYVVSIFPVIPSVILESCAEQFYVSCIPLGFLWSFSYAVLDYLMMRKDIHTHTHTKTLTYTHTHTHTHGKWERTQQVSYISAPGTWFVTKFIPFA